MQNVWLNEKHRIITDAQLKLIQEKVDDVQFSIWAWSAAKQDRDQLWWVHCRPVENVDTAHVDILSQRGPA